MSRKTNKLANQEIRENYGDKSVQGAIAIFAGQQRTRRRGQQILGSTRRRERV